MQTHISAITRGADHQLHILRKLKPFRPVADRTMAVQALVLSKLYYSSISLVGLPQTSLAPLKDTLKAAARLITGPIRSNHITPDLQSLKWLPFEARIHFKIAYITHKALHYNTPSYLTQKLTLSGGNGSSRSTSSLLLKPQKFKKNKTYNRSFSGIAPKIWNSLLRLDVHIHL